MLRTTNSIEFSRSTAHFSKNTVSIDSRLSGHSTVISHFHDFQLHMPLISHLNYLLDRQMTAGYPCVDQKGVFSFVSSLSSTGLTIELVFNNKSPVNSFSYLVVFVSCFGT